MKSLQPAATRAHASTVLNQRRGRSEPAAPVEGTAEALLAEAAKERATMAATGGSQRRQSATVTSLRGGCPGSEGGPLGTANTATGGHGGGAVAFLAGSAITI